jgi:choline dehydrogenase-like flavoprotein
LIPDLNGENRSRGSGGYGIQLKNDYRRFYGAFVHLAGRGEAIARQDNYCEIDPDVVDKYGIPVLRLNYAWSDHERKQARHMHNTFEEIFHSMGGIPLGEKPGQEDDFGLLSPGSIIHEVGTTRMGKDPETSVLNKYCQAHDVKNLFIVDGGPFVSQADKNPTWTILALAMRTSEYLIEQVKQQNL